MLLPDFRWRSVISHADGLPDVLLCDNVEVLRFGQRADDRVRWVWLDRHLPSDRLKDRACASYEQGVVGSALRAIPRRGRLRVEVQQRRLREVLRLNRTGGSKAHPARVPGQFQLASSAGGLPGRSVSD